MLGEGDEKGELVPKEMENSYRHSAKKKKSLGMLGYGSVGTVSPSQSLSWPCLRGFMENNVDIQCWQGRMVVPRASSSP